MRMSAEDLFQKTGLIFVGRVLAVDTAAGGDIDALTRVTFRIEKFLGAVPAGEDIELSLPGGHLSDGSFVEIVGAPQFAIGHTYLVFLRDGPWENTPVTNWSHSVFREEVVDGRSYFVSPSGHCVERFDARGFYPGPRLTARQETPYGWLADPPPSSGALDPMVVSNRAPGCLAKDAVWALVQAAASQHLERMSAAQISSAPSGVAIERHPVRRSASHALSGDPQSALEVESCPVELPVQ